MKKILSIVTILILCTHISFAADQPKKEYTWQEKAGIAGVIAVGGAVVWNIFKAITGDDKNDKIDKTDSNSALSATETEEVVETEGSTSTGSLNGHNATFLFDGANLRMMNLLSPHVNIEQFKQYVSQMKNAGANFVYLYLANQGDGPWTPYTFYQDNQLGQTVDEGVVNQYKEKLEYVRSQGLGISLWLRADDSGGFAKVAKARQEKYQEDSVQYFDSFTESYVIGLEADEYMSANDTNHYAGHIKKLTSKEIGVHMTGGETSYCKLSNIDACYYQYGFDKSASEIESDTKKVVAELGGKPVYASEYHLSSESSEAKALGDAAMRGGASGTGNNRNNVESTSQEEDSSVEISTSPGQPDDFEIGSTNFLHSNVSNWPEASSLDSVNISSNSITYNHNKASSWKEIQIEASNGSGKISVNANPWIIVKKNGKWHACTHEWMRVGQTSKSRASVNGDHCKRAPLNNWVPTPGEKVGFMVSGLARSGTPGSHERTNIKWVTWPQSGQSASSN